jgi:flagellar assembly protein FliH
MVKEVDGVTEYTFQSFTNTDVDADVVKNFDFKPLFDKGQTQNSADFQKTIKIERNNAHKSQFKINSVVEEHRGLKDQAEAEYEARVQDDVEKRVLAIQEKAYKVGFDEGVNQGREEIFNEMRSVVDQKLDNFSQMVTEVLKTQEDILSLQRKEIYGLVRNLSKWIILRELKDDGGYVERLFEKLLVEIQERNNLLVLVNENKFKAMPEILEHVSSRLGQLKNVRIEVDSSVDQYGLIVESDNGIINATLEEQFKSLDKLFADLIVENE